MRRFLAFGCQEPSSLLCCPAEAASPPPISAFQRSPINSFSNNLLQSPLPLSAATTAADRLFTNIERQLSAKIAFIDPQLLTARGEGGGDVSAIDEDKQKSSPLSTISSSTTISQRQQEQQNNNNISDNNIFNFSKKDVEQKNEKNNEVKEPPPPQKGLDSFFAALANSTDNNNGEKKQEKTVLQNQLICSTAQFNNLPQNNVISTTTTTTTFPSTNNSTTNYINNNNNISNNTIITTTPNNNNLINNVIANAAVNIVNAAIAVQQQNHHNQQQQQQLAALQFVAQSAASLPLSSPQQEGLNAQVGALLNQLSSPNISKPIPLLEDKVDLMRFKRKEPREWSDDDVIAWILDVARRHRIPCENMNLTKFAKCSGPLLMLMNEQSFNEQDPNYGSLLFGEFCKLVTDENFIDEWMRINGPSCSDSISDNQRRHSSTIKGNSQSYQQQQQPINSMNRANNVGNLLMANLALKLSGTQTSDSTGQQGLILAAAGIAANNQQQHNYQHHHHHQQQRLTGQLSPLGQLLSPTVGGSSSLKVLQQQHQTISPLEVNNIHIPAPLNNSQRQQQICSSINHILQQQPGGSQQNNLGGGKMGIRGMRQNQRNFKVSEQKIRRNKDGKPRKRSQHTKGNKLWEFIRDALKDPRTCPSIVRWEDPSEGVFRIVESERLAFLWGQKKNNQRMTYEKLSRAMRTYYEKEILVPVPKSGLYPKKLVYKFGPTAMGWKTAASMATHLVISGNSNDISSNKFNNNHHQQQQLYRL